MKQTRGRQQWKSAWTGWSRGSGGRFCGWSCRRPGRGRLGLIPGAGIACLRRVPLGDPAVYRFGGLTAAMRRGDAAGIIVAPERADLGSSG